MPALSAYSLCGITGGMKELADHKIKAIKLRKKGLSYSEIIKEINVAKSSLSLWLKHIKLKPEHQKRLYTKKIQILCLGSKSQKERRAREVKELLKNAEDEVITPLSFDAFRLFGAALYWAEGSKGRLFELTNSDPYMILFMVRWIERILKIPPQNLKLRLNIYPQQNEVKIKKFWSELTGIPLQNFGKSYIKPLSKNYKKNNLYYGTARIEVPKSTNMQYRVSGWVKKVLKDIDPHVKLEQYKWGSLKKTARPVNL